MSLFNQRLLPASPWSQTGMNAWSNPYYSLFERLPYNSIWNRPQTFIYHIHEKQYPSFESKKLSKRGGCYYMTERNRREVRIGELTITDKTIVNPSEDGRFDCFCCAVKYESQNDKKFIQIPFQAFVRRQISPYLHEFRRNPDCPESYIVLAFFEELLDGDTPKFLQLPKHSGWNSDEQHAFFVSAEATIPQLSAYYAPNIHARKLPRTDTTLADAARTLSKELPPNWKAKLLLAASTACYLLSFFADAGLQPDKLLIIKPDSEQNAKFATALLSTQNYSDTRSCLLTECRTVLEKELNTTYDGMCVFRDSSYTENRKRREAGLDVLIQDLN